MITIVGELNPYGARPEYALYPDPPGCAGHRLMKILGLSEEEYLALGRVNLCVRKWSGLAARNAAVQLFFGAGEGDAFVMLGRKVAAAFYVTGDPLPPFSVCTIHGVTFASLPHPSGRCRAWNATDAVAHAREVLRIVTLRASPSSAPTSRARRQ